MISNNCIQTIDTACTNLFLGFFTDYSNCDTLKPVIPFVNCTTKFSNNTCRTYFGYKNDNPFVITISVGSNNKFHEASDRGLRDGISQPTQFQAGVNNHAFSVLWDCSHNHTLTWFLTNQTVVATATDTCTGACCNLTNCNIETFSNCSTYGMSYAGAFTNCLLSPCGVPTPVIPISGCVIAFTNGTCRRYWGYNNTNPTTIYIPVGEKNFFSPIPINDGQPTHFEPGVHSMNSIPPFVFFNDRPCALGNLTWSITIDTSDDL